MAGTKLSNKLTVRGIASATLVDGQNTRKLTDGRGLTLLIRNGKEIDRRVLARLPVRLHRRQLLRLVLGDVGAMDVALGDVIDMVIFDTVDTAQLEIVVYPAAP